MMNWRRPGAILTLILTLAACGSDPGFNEAVDFAPKEGSVQFINMIPQSPLITVIHGRDTTTADFPVAQPAELRFEDRYDWRIAYLDSANLEVTVTQDENQQITEDVLSVFFMMGSLDQPNIQIVDIPVPAADELTDGMTRVAFASNLSDVAMTDIYITDPTSSLSDTAPTLTMTSGTTTDVLETGSGSKRIRVTSAGTDTLLFDSGTIEFTEKTVELFGLVDDFGPDPAAHVDLIRARTSTGSIMEDISQSPQVRLGNFSTIDNLSATLGTLSFDSVGKETSTSYLTAASGTQDYAVTNDDQANAVLETKSFDPRPGTFNSIYVFDDLDSTGSQTRSLLVTDFSRPITARSLFKFINGNNQNIDVYILDAVAGQTVDNTAPLLNDLTPIATSTSESLSKPVEFTITNSDGSETLATASYTFVEGKSYTLLFDASAQLHLITDE